MGKAVYLPFAVYVASDLGHPVHQVVDHSSEVVRSIDLDFGIVVDLAGEARFLDALVDPVVSVVRLVPEDPACASDGCAVVSFLVACWDPFPSVGVHLAHLAHPVHLGHRAHRADRLVPHAVLPVHREVPSAYPCLAQGAFAHSVVPGLVEWV